MGRIDHFFDINCMIGVWPYYPLGYADAAELDAHMRALRITGAAVGSFAAYRHSFAAGNRQLFRDLAPYPHMLACPNLWPLLDGEDGWADTRAYLDDLQERGAKLVRVSPEKVGFSVTAGYFRPILEELARRRMPMLVDLNELPNEKEDVERLCRENPALRLVVLHQSHERSRGVYFLLRQFPNLYFETSFLSDQEELEQIVAYAGSRGLLWGTRMPHFEPGRMAARMTYSDLPLADLQAICYGNAERLLDDVR